MVPVAAPGWVVWWSARGEEDLVDEGDGGVGGLEVAADHAGVAVDREVLAAAADLDGVALEGLVAAGELVRGELAGDHVVGEHGGQQPLGGAQGLVGGGVGHRGEGVVGGREHGDALGAVQGAGQAGLLDRGDQGGQLGGVGGGGGHRVLGQGVQAAGAAGGHGRAGGPERGGRGQRWGGRGRVGGRLASGGAGVVAAAGGTQERQSEDTGHSGASRSEETKHWLVLSRNRSGGDGAGRGRLRGADERRDLSGLVGCGQHGGGVDGAAGQVHLAEVHSAEDGGDQVELE